MTDKKFEKVEDFIKKGQVRCVTNGKLVRRVPTLKKVISNIPPELLKNRGRDI